MNLAVIPLHPLFVAKITSVDLRNPIDEGTQLAIERAMDDYAVCVLPGQRLEDEHQIAFSRLYGPLELSPPKQDKSGKAIYNTRVRHREIFDISNLDEDGKILDDKDARSAYRLGNELWHTDSSFRQKSATWSMLHARVIPPKGGNTEFVDTRAAYDALPEAMKKKLEGLVAEHSIWHSRAKHGGYTPTEEERKLRPGAQHRLVRRHPGSGRNALYIASHASHIIGMPVEEGQALLSESNLRRNRGSSTAILGTLGPGDLGQPRHHAPRDVLRGYGPCSRHAPHDHHRHACRGSGRVYPNAAECHDRVTQA